MKTLNITTFTAHVFQRMAVCDFQDKWGKVGNAQVKKNVSNINENHVKANELQNGIRNEDFNTFVH